MAAGSWSLAHPERASDAFGNLTPTEVPDLAALKNRRRCITWATRMTQARTLGGWPSMAICCREDSGGLVAEE